MLESHILFEMENQNPLQLHFQRSEDSIALYEIVPLGLWSDRAHGCNLSPELKRGIEKESYMPPVLPYWPGDLIPKRMGKRIRWIRNCLQGKGRVVRTYRIPTRAVRSDSSIASSSLLLWFRRCCGCGFKILMLVLLSARLLCQWQKDKVGSTLTPPSDPERQTE